MKTLPKALVGTIAAGAMAVAATTPAQARDVNDRHHDGISAGEVIAGAVILGGLAAVLSSSHKNRDYRSTDYRYGNRDYRDYRDYRDHRDYRGQSYRGGHDNARYAVEQCVRAAQRSASYRTGGRARVYDVRGIDRRRHGLRVRGTIAVQHRHGRYGRNYRHSSWDRGSFSCEVRRGRVTDLDFRGIRHLR